MIQTITERLYFRRHRHRHRHLFQFREENNHFLFGFKVCNA